MTYREILREELVESDGQRRHRTPWGTEGGVADLIIASLQGHPAVRVADLRRAATYGSESNAL